MGTSRGEYKKREIDLIEVERLASLGLSIIDCCRSIEVIRNKFDTYRGEESEISEENPDFNPAKAAYYRGKAQGVSEVLEAVKTEALNGSTHAMKIFLDSQGYGKKPPAPTIENKAPTLNLFLTPSPGEVNPGITIDQETSETTAGLNIILQK